MDVETEKIIVLLFPDGISETWKDNPDFYQYLTKIGRYDVDALNREPDYLTDEKNAIEQNTQNLVFSDYKIFICTAENSREIFKEFNQTEGGLDSLLEKIPKFVNKCKSYCKTSKDINNHRILNSLILNKSAELLEILELPQVMDSCLRSNQYNEALELSQYAKHLDAKYGDIPIITNIVNEIQNFWSLMVNQVVDSLKEDLPLPRCLHLIGLLRSMDAFTESELRIKFIQARDSWLQTLLKSTPTDNSNVHLMKTIELSRIHLFNIITQYKAMFNDDHLALGRDTINNDASIFHQWLEEKVSQFLTTLEQDLPDVTSIDSILGQCTYFGLSFGRVGADFTGRISDIFIKIISNKFENSITKATNKFRKDIENFTLVYKFQKSDFKIEPDINSFENPPDQLVEYYPLAEYYNGLAGAFNELRLNTPVAFTQLFTNLLQSSLHIIAKAMFSFYKKRQKNFTSADRENIVRFCVCFSEQLIPYIQHCIHTLFPPHQVAAHLGTSVTQLQKEEISYLNQKYILEPLEALLPVKNILINFLPDMVSSKDSLDGESNIDSESSQELNKEAVIDLCIEKSILRATDELRDSSVVQDTKKFSYEGNLN